jgi:hypothetical protein
MNGGGDSDNGRLEYVLDAISKWIQQSDSKAGFVMAANSLIIAGLTSAMKGLLVPAFGFGSAISVVFSLLLACGVAAIVFSVYYCVAAVVPRLKMKQPSSNIYFGHIATNKDREAFVKGLLTVAPEDYRADLASQIYVNSLICWRKHKCVSAGFQFMASSIVFIVASLGILLGGTL